MLVMVWSVSNGQAISQEVCRGSHGGEKIVWRLQLKFGEIVS